MAYFDALELVDCLRNVFAVEDDTGMSCKVLDKPTRRPKLEGISLSFAASESDSEEDMQYSPHYVPDLNEQSAIESTSKAINEYLLAKFRATHSQCAQNLVNKRPLKSITSDLFGAKTISERGATTSMTSRLLASVSLEPSDKAFNKYAKFEATAATPRASVRKMTIVFPFCQPDPCALNISIVTALRPTLADLIGLSCHVYTRECRQPKCEDPSLYSLYLAEENMEYDLELPPQDRHRLVAECGFPVLAMVKNSEVSANKDDYSVNVYFANRQRATFTLESLDVPLQWLFDKALHWRSVNIASNVDQRNAAYLREIPYILETVEQRGVPLKLSNTISSTGCFDFVLIRENSSRGELFPSVGGAGNSSVGASQTTTSFTLAEHLHASQSNYELRSLAYDLQSTSTPNDARQTDSSSTDPLKNHLLSDMIFRGGNGVEKRDVGGVSGDASPLIANEGINSYGQILDEFAVLRKRRLKPKCSAKLLICENGLALHSAESADGSRKSKTFARSVESKTLSIFWEFIASAEVSQKERINTRRLIRIIWLKVPDIYCPFFSDRLSSAKNRSDFLAIYNDEHFARGFELSSWKTLQLEVSNEDAWKIGIKLSDILDIRSTHIQRIYQHSYGATKRPLQAATELAMNLRSTAAAAAGTINTSTFPSSHSDNAASDKSSSSYSQSQSTTSTTANTRPSMSSTAAAASVATSSTNAKKAERRKVSINMRGMAFSRMFSKPN